MSLNPITPHGVRGKWQMRGCGEDIGAISINGGIKDTKRGGYWEDSTTINPHNIRDIRRQKSRTWRRYSWPRDKNAGTRYKRISHTVVGPSLPSPVTRHQRDILACPLGSRPVYLYKHELNSWERGEGVVGRRTISPDERPMPWRIRRWWRACRGRRWRLPRRYRLGAPRQERRGRSVLWASAGDPWLLPRLHCR